jgi:GTP-binding protein YchF
MLTASRVFYRRGAGIVGLPNIGKSTLFNALTCSQQAKTGNYPFCTIDANLAKVDVYDSRLRTLAKFSGAPKIVDVEIDLADVAGLIEGASKGAGLGNKFLADIRPCNIVLHMVRCFESAKDGFDAPDPLRDIAVIENELILADLDVMEKRFAKMRAKRSNDPELRFAERVVQTLTEGVPAHRMKITDVSETQSLREYGLLSAKPMLYVLNVDDNSVAVGNNFSKVVEEKFGEHRVCRLCASIEEQTSQFTREERLEFLKAYNIEAPCGEELLGKVYKLLNLETFFTVGPNMAHAWTMRKGATAKEASGEIHGDFAKHFRSASVCAWDKFAACVNLKQAEQFAMQQKDASYVMQDGDVIIVQHDAPRR